MAGQGGRLCRFRFHCGVSEYRSIGEAAQSGQECLAASVRPCRAVKMRADIHTLPDTNPLRMLTCRIRVFRVSYWSHLYQVATTLRDVAVEQLETIQPLTLALREERVEALTDDVAAVRGGSELVGFSFTLGMRTEPSPCSGELEAMVYALRRTMPELRRRSIALMTSSLAGSRFKNIYDVFTILPKSSSRMVTF